MTLNISQVFSDAMRSISERFGSLMGVWAVFFGLLIATGIVFGIVMAGAMAGVMGMASGMEPGPEALAGLGGGAILGILLFYGVLLYVSSAANAALTSTASLLHRPEMGKAIGDGFRSGLSVMGAILLVVIPLVIVLMVLSMIGSALGSAGGIITLFATIGICLYVSARVSVLVPVISVEGERNPITALTRSWNLTGSSVLQIVLVYVIVVAAVLAIGFVLAMVLGGMFASMMGAGAAPGLGTMLFGFILYIVVIAAYMIFLASLAAALHSQLAGASGTNLGETFG